MSACTNIRQPTGVGSGISLAAPPLRASPALRPAHTIVPEKWIPTIFASKTAASGLLALLIAFAFNLDQPKWALLTVFIVAQPQSGLVLAKSFYRIIGTVVGAIAALFLVSLFAQERVLFLGSLAIWIGFCTIASKQTRNFASYGFVLSGYTAAIVGVTGALAPANAFDIATARVTEISLGIMVTALISHLVLPVSLADAVRNAIAVGRADIISYAQGVLAGHDSNQQRIKLFGQATEIKRLSASAIFEDSDIRSRSNTFRLLDIAMLRVAGIGRFLEDSSSWLARFNGSFATALAGSLSRASIAIDLWGRDDLSADGLRQSLIEASASLPLARALYRQPSDSDEDAIQGAALIGRLREFFAAVVEFAEAFDAFSLGSPSARQSPALSLANDRVDAVCAGFRAAMALLSIGSFWIVTDWSDGATATILGAVATARLATMEHALTAAMGGTAAVVVALLPAFFLTNVLLPDATGFEMFSLAVTPMLFFFAYLMARPKTAGLGFVGGLYFANVSAFQDRMTYDPLGFLNVSIAVALAIAGAAVLFALINPDSPQSVRRSFIRIARNAFMRIARERPRIGLLEFETTMTEALDQLSRTFRSGGREDISTLEAGIALLGAGRELLRIRDDRSSGATTMDIGREVALALDRNQPAAFDRARRIADKAVRKRLAELREDKLGIADARVAAREMVAFAAVRDTLSHALAILLEVRAREAPSHAA
jgi:uncharacterized membrane protein YccC